MLRGSEIRAKCRSSTCVFAPIIGKANRGNRPMLPSVRGEQRWFKHQRWKSCSLTANSYFSWIVSLLGCMKWLELTTCIMHLPNIYKLTRICFIKQIVLMIQFWTLKVLIKMDQSDGGGRGSRGSELQSNATRQTFKAFEIKFMKTINIILPSFIIFCTLNVK